MKSVACKAVVAMATVAVIAACASGRVPVQNFSDVPIAAKSAPSLEQVGRAITAGSLAAGWQASEIKPGNIMAVYKIRTHTAIVDIGYTTTSYNITFKEGDPGLKYDGQTIHQNYNDWVSQLERIIRAHVNAL
jgi:hypothetical protein